MFFIWLFLLYNQKYYINSINYILRQKATSTPVRNILYFCEDADFNDALQIIIQLQHYLNMKKIL